MDEDPRLAVVATRVLIPKEMKLGHLPALHCYLIDVIH